MSKKSLDIKAAQKFIVESRDSGITDREIYNELSQRYFDKKTVALLIIATVKTENKNKYRTYNNILIGLLGLAFLLHILFVFSMTIQLEPLWTLLHVFLFPLLAVGFAYEIARYRPVYRYCGIMAIAVFINSISIYDIGTNIFINLVFAVAIAGLSFYLDRKIFPNFSTKNIMKDSNGEYILN